MKLLALFFIAALAAVVRGQGTVARCGGTSAYRGRCVDAALVAREPATYECQRARGRSQAEVFACFLGANEARAMAAQYGGGHGRMFGVDRGLAAGMHDAHQRAAVDPAFVDEGRRLVDRLTGYIEPAVRTQSTRGGEWGTRDGSAAAEALFERAVITGESGRLPQRAMGVIQPPPYEGERDQFRRLVPQDGEYASLEPRQILDRMEREYARYNIAYDHINDRSRPYMGEVTRLRLRDLWVDNGVYDFDERRWTDGQIAWRSWLTQSGLPRRQYDSLGRNPPEDIARKPDTGDPVMGADGKPVCNAVRKDPRTGAVLGCALVDLQAVFQRAFVEAYGHHAPYHFTTQLYAGLDDGYRQGLIIGTELGRRVARTRGLTERFNADARERTRVSFASAYEREYDNGFNITFDRFRTQPVLAVELLDVVGQVTDGVLEPGEPFGVRVRVTNRGGVGAPLDGAVTGTVEATGTFRDSIGPLTSREYTTAVVGRLDPRLRPGQRADVRVAVNGTPARSLDVVLRRAVQLDPAGTAIDGARGSATVTVALRNGSTVRTSGDVVAVFTLDGREQRRTLPPLEPGESRSVPFEVSGLDPLRLLPAGNTPVAHVRTQVGAQLMDEQDVRVYSVSPDAALVGYYALLVQPAGERPFVPSGIAIDDRIADVEARLVAANQAELRGSRVNVWKETPRSTVVGMIRDAQQSTAHTDVSWQRFRELGERLWKDRTHLGSFLFIKSAKRKAYERIVKDIRREP